MDILEEEKDIIVVGKASDGVEAIELIHKHCPHIVILDLDMPGKAGLEVATYIQQKRLIVHPIVLTMYKDQERFNRAMELGIKGYILKENTIDEIVNCIYYVHRKGIFISPNLSEYLLAQIHLLRNGEEEPKFVSKLTPSEKRVLLLVSQMKTSKEIGELLFISNKTVENHRSNICRKLKLRGSNSLVKFAIEHRSAIEKLKV